VPADDGGHPPLLKLRRGKRWPARLLVDTTPMTGRITCIDKRFKVIFDNALFNRLC
jgi:hypothetical protein